MSLDRRLGSFQSDEDVDQFRMELVDRFASSENLLEILKLKIACQKANIETRQGQICLEFLSKPI